MLLRRSFAVTSLTFALSLGACSSSDKKAASVSSDGGADAHTSNEDAGTVSLGELTSPGRYAVATRDFTFVDTTRATPSNGTYAGAATRTLPTRVWFPEQAATDGGSVASGGPFPTLLYAHGFLSNLAESDSLKRHLASHGYVVIAPTFPLSNGSAPGGPTFGDVAHQPGDLEFALHSVESESGNAAQIGALVDESRLGILGLSLGGATVLIAAFHPTLHLKAVRAAVAFAPASCFFADGIYKHSVPTVLVSGSSDELVPFETVQHVFQVAPAPLTFVELVGGTHVGFTGIDVPGVDNSDALGCSAVQGAFNTAGSAGIAGNLASDLAPGVTGSPADVAACGGDGGQLAVCLEKKTQSMTSARQITLAGAVALAHFESTLRGRVVDAKYLTGQMAKDAADVMIMSK
jgi:predicted dienelactone hydrolase